MEAAFPGCHPGSDRQQSAPLVDRAHPAPPLDRAYLVRHRGCHLRHQDLGTRAREVPLNLIQIQESNQDLAFHRAAGHRFPARQHRVHLGSVQRQSVQRSRVHLQIQACPLLGAIRRGLPLLPEATEAFSRGDLPRLTNKLEIERVHSDCQACSLRYRTTETRLHLLPNPQAAIPERDRRRRRPK